MHKQSKKINGQKIIHERHSFFPLVLEYLERNPQFKSIFSEPFQLYLIVDANIIIKDLIWLTRTRTKENALTQLLEILQTKIVTAVAPVYLIDEIEENIPIISKEKKISKKRLSIAWKEYKKYIIFVEHKDSPELHALCKRDPDDAPYVSLNSEYGYPVYTEDKDISGMGATVIDNKFISNYRDYTKDADSAYAIQICGISGVIVTGKIIQSLFSLISKIPEKVLMIALGFIAILLIYKPTREYILSKLEKVGENMPQIIDVLTEAMGYAFDTYKENKDNAEEKKNLLITQINQLENPQLDPLSSNAIC
jgi:predicted nucleic acid-binding protein